MKRRAFRFAPSPNGELHLGHAYSALLNHHLASECGGRFLLRIEDIDTLRCTQALAAMALADLGWLGLQWELPVRYQSQHLAEYRLQQNSLQRLEVLYPCFCSRKGIAARTGTAVRDPEGQPTYDGFCKSLSAAAVSRLLETGQSFALRLDMAKALTACRRKLRLDPSAWGDVVLVRKDIGTSYHIAVVTDDALQGITDVVRGRDLEQATSIHILLQSLLGFPVPRYLHHDLITDAAGHKLSKSLHSRALRSLRDGGVTAAEIRHSLGFDWSKSRKS